MTSPPLFDFKAGRVQFNATTGKATPLAGQGRVTLLRSSEDPSLLGMQWLPRGANNSAPGGEELLLVPGDVEFTHVPHCQTGRVIQMRFNSSGERHLFWLQDAPKGDLHELSKDDEAVLEKLNELANLEDLDESENDAMDHEADHEAEYPQTRETDNLYSSLTTSAAPVADATALNTNSAAQNLYSAIITRIGENRQGSSEVPMSRLISQARRVEHVQHAEDWQVERLLEHTKGLATTRDDLCEVLLSPHFARCMDELCHAALLSPSVAREFGLFQAPMSTENLLEELRKLQG